MKIIRTVAILAAGGLLAAGCGSGGGDRTARLEAEVAALKSQVTSTTASEPTTTSSAPTTTTTGPVTTTTVKLVTTTTRKPVPTTTTTTRPWCSIRALASPVTRGMTQTIYVTSNLPGRKAVLGHQEVAMDAGGAGQYSFAATGGYMDQYGHFSPRTVTITVPFYTAPWTLEMVVDKPAPPLLTSCSTTFLAIGPS